MICPRPERPDDTWLMERSSHAWYGRRDASSSLICSFLSTMPRSVSTANMSPGPRRPRSRMRSLGMSTTPTSDAAMTLLLSVSQ